MRNIATLHKPSTPFAAVNRLAFSVALDTASKIVDQKVTIPILAAVKIEVKGEALTLTATNLDIELRLRLDVSPDSTDMTAVLLLAPLKQFLKMTQGELIRITSNDDGDMATVSCGESSIEMATFDANDFPDAGAIAAKGSAKMTVSPSPFWRALDCVKPAISSDETRYYLRGVYMHGTPDGLCFVTTDGHRLHKKQSSLAPKSKAVPVIIPTAVVKLLTSIIAPTTYPADLAITISADGSRARFALGNFVILAKMIDGTFPDYGRTIPAADERVATLKSEDIDKILKNIAFKETKGVSLAFFKDNCQVKVSHPEHGTMTTALPCELDGEPVVIGFNRHYLRAMIGEASPGGGRVTIRMGDPGGPAKIEGRERGFTGVLMPMRV